MVATSHRRIAVIRDPELDAALRRVGPLVGPDLPAATLLRALALRGAAAVEADPGAEVVARLVAGRGARAASASVADVLERLGDAGPPDPTRRASRILDEQRAERLP